MSSDAFECTKCWNVVISWKAAWAQEAPRLRMVLVIDLAFSRRSLKHKAKVKRPQRSGS